jgi:hypothetical protein
MLFSYNQLLLITEAHNITISVPQVLSIRKYFVAEAPSSGTGHMQTDTGLYPRILHYYGTLDINNAVILYLPFYVL